MTTNLYEPTVQKIENLELFLLNLRYREGRLIEIEGNKPLLLDDPDDAYVVYSGTVDTFVVPVQDGEVVGTRSHLFHSSVGQLLLGVSDRSQRNLGLLVSGPPGTRVLRLHTSRLREMASDIEVGEYVEAMLNDWVTALSMSIAKSVIPHDYVILRPGDERSVVEDQAATPDKGVLWIRTIKGGAQFLDQPQVSFGANGHYLPLSRNMWLRSTDSSEMKALDTNSYLKRENDWKGLRHFHQLFLDTIVLNRARDSEEEMSRLHKKAEAEQAVMGSALYRLSTPLAPPDQDSFVNIVDTSNSLLAASQLVGNAMGVHIHVDTSAEEEQTLGELFKSIQRTSRVRTREVNLQGAWWHRDNGPILAFIEASQNAVALIPTKPGQYELHDPIERRKVPVDKKVATTLLPYGFSFYRPFPDKALSAWDLLKYGSRGVQYDIRLVFLLGALIGLLGLVTPIVTGRIFDTIIPNGDTVGLIQIGGLLIALAISAGVFQFTRGLAVLRAQTRMDVSVQAALWDRLLSLPTPFFRNYSAGDLATRAMGISQIRRVLSGYLVDTILTSIFSIFNLVLLFVYSPRLALVALGLVAVSILVTVFASTRFVQFQRAFFDVQGDLSGRVLQLLTGIVKFRVSGAENQAFSLWAESFSEQKRITYEGRAFMNGLRAFNAAYPVLATLTVFGVFALSQDLGLSLGDFLAFNAAFIQFMMAWFILGTVVLQALVAIPLYERLRPILDAVPEISEAKIDPGTLSGAIEVNHVSFRYREDSPLVLRDVSLNINPGDFVAFVGSSGSGKSTMMRLLLGFEAPEAGALFFDEQDLDDLDVRRVREQIGVVLQNATLMAGDIYTNIVGSSPDLTVDDAWEAARMAGLDKDIEDMPMGMHTVVSERGGTFSGGQRQRLLIARALVNRPSILFFDEATSALDNRTQEIVSKSLEDLHATRIVIAHRLSTIINADQIFVFENGQIVQRGTYGELIKQEGPFAEMARRQVV